MKTFLLIFILLASINLYCQNGEIVTIKIADPSESVDQNERQEIRKHIYKLNRELAKTKDTAFIYRGRVLAYLSLQEYSAAISDLNKLIELDNEDAEAYVFRGISKNLSQKYYAITSCDDFKKAKELNYTKADWKSIGKDCADK